jgi:hypothetical protein
MTDTTPEPASATTPTPGLPAGRDRRWGESRRRGGRPLRLAALVVTLAGIVFIVAVIFWSGFVLGACAGGGHHHGHGERGSSQEGGGPDEQNDGMAPYGVLVEPTMPLAAFAG